MTNKRIYIAADRSTRLTYRCSCRTRGEVLGHGLELRFVRPMGDHLVGATMFDGMVVQPRMVDSLEVKPPQ